MTVETIATLTDAEKQERIRQLYGQKKALLDKYGIFGGGEHVNMLHKQLNDELEKLGIDANS